MKDIFQWIFGPLVLLVFILFLLAVWQEYHPPYLSYQKQFKAMLVKEAGPKEKSIKFKYGIRQIWVKSLNRADRCETCHLGVSDPRFKDAKEPFRTHPDFATHDFQKFGCTICHGGQGRAITVDTAHGPVTNWYKAIYNLSFIENSCSKCHGVRSNGQMPEYAYGHSIFNEEGCIGCHKVKGLQRTQIAPPLNNMGGQVKMDWLFRWIRSPEAYLPHTRMPDYKFSDIQSADIARFLMQLGQSQKIELTGSYDNGKKIFNESRCVSCHSVGRIGGTIGPNLEKVATKLEPAALFRMVKNPHNIWSGTKMPIYGFSDSEAMDVATFMDQEYIDFDLTDKERAQQKALVEKAHVADGQKLVGQYGCVGCHGNISGIKNEGEIGPDLTNIDGTHISHFVFGKIDVDPKDRTVPNWLYNKILDPRLYNADLKMPDFHFTPDKAVAITTYLLSLKGDIQVPDNYKRPFEQMAVGYDPQGEFGGIIKKYRCLVCHKIYGNGGTMAPELTWEGSRVQKDWLMDYLKIPYAIRPLLVERMPRFKMTDAEREAVYDYFHTTLLDDRVENLAAMIEDIPLNQKDIIHSGKNLFYNKYGCDACHTVNLKGGSIAPDLTNAGKRLFPRYVNFYLHNPKAYVTRSVEPVYHFSEKEIDELTAFIVSPKEIK